MEVKPAPSVNIFANQTQQSGQIDQVGNNFRTATNSAQHLQDTQVQVQNSILSMAKNGTKVLEVSLNPVELGQLQLTLTSQHGEVNVAVRAEKAESASLINRQLDAIKAELENQGFKIENISVEVGLSKDSRQEWQGMDSHNHNRDFNENMQYFDRLRQLNRIGSSDEATLARNMQSISHTADNAPSGLYVVA